MVRCCLLATSLRFDQGYTDICVVASAPPRKLDPVRSLANVAIFTLVRRLWCGVTPGLVSFGLPPKRSGGVAVTPAAFSGRNRLRLLSTIVLVGLVMVWR